MPGCLGKLFSNNGRDSHDIFGRNSTIIFEKTGRRRPHLVCLLHIAFCVTETNFQCCNANYVRPYSSNDFSNFFSRQQLRIHVRRSIFLHDFPQDFRSRLPFSDFGYHASKPSTPYHTASDLRALLPISHFLARPFARAPNYIGFANHGCPHTGPNVTKNQSFWASRKPFPSYWRGSSSPFGLTESALLP